MDAFFAAVEQRDNPQLRGKPVIVGAPPNRRGVVSTCSYEARRFGVHSAMPSREAYRRCPNGIFLPVRGQRYAEVSKQVIAIFECFTPFVEKLSIDEAFLDVTGSMRLFGGAVGTAERLREAIRRDLQLTASVGVAPNKFLAKLASDINKPDGTTIVPREQHEIEAFLAPLPIERIWGVGKVTSRRLHDLGLSHIADLQRLSEADLQVILGDKGGSHIYRLSRGIDRRKIVTSTPEKSISHEHTYPEDCRDWRIVRQTLLELTEKVGARLRASSKHASTAHLKLRWFSFKTITRQAAFAVPTDTDADLIAIALDLLAREECSKAVRLVGFGVSKLVDPDSDHFFQPDLFGEADPTDKEKDQDLDTAVDQIRRRFGRDILKRGDWKRD